MKITIPQNSVLGVYIDSSCVAVIKTPTIEKILIAVREELVAEDVTTVTLFPDITFEWDTKYDFKVRVDDGEEVFFEEAEQRTETVELMPIVCY